MSAAGRLAAPGQPRRLVPAPLVGVTVDDVSRVGEVAASLRHLARRPTVRIYFDVREPPSYYARAVRLLRPVSYLMGELLDSSDEQKISVPAFGSRVRGYLRAFGPKIDIWEIGNEVNGAWLGSYRPVSARLSEAYREVAARGYATALTLYYNARCGDGSRELSPIAFTRRYVPPAVRRGLSYVLLSYYEDDCHGLRPSARQWTAYYRRLHAWYPRARLGFGEIGMNDPATARTTAAARSLISHYYGLSIKLPYYVGGYFWWYYAEDCVPYRRKPLWAALDQAIR